MIWLTWRQHRKQAFYTLVALVAMAAVFIPTGLAMHHTFTSSGLAACLAKLGTAAVVPDANTCDSLSQQFANQYSGMTFIGILFVILPVFVGIFFGAPLVAREIEHGTHRLVWTQGVSRRHWALVKFGLVGTVVLVLAVVYALGMTWWFTPLVQNGGGRMGDISFDVQGVVPVAYTLFAVAAGMFAGALFKRVLPAMGVTLAAYVVVRVVIEAVARPRYMSPLTASIPIDSSSQFNQWSGAWVYSQGVVNGKGTTVLQNGNVSCGSAPAGSARAAAGGGGGCGQALLQQGLGPGPFANAYRYQPSSRFWEFQGIETGIFIALTALLVFLTVRRVRQIS
jgi:ABC-type transport system involved in multi-copper enzyme maturation permease subunit